MIPATIELPAPILGCTHARPLNIYIGPAFAAFAAEWGDQVMYGEAGDV